MSNKILVITGSFYPTFSPPGLVLARLLKTVSRQCDITVITQRRGRHDLGREFEYAGMKVYEVSDWFADRLIAGGPFTRVWKLIYRVLSFFRGNKLSMFNPSKTVRLAKRLCKEGDFKKMITMGFPFESHVVGLKIKRSFPEINWATYSTDTYHKHFMFSKKVSSIRQFLNTVYFCGACRAEVSAYRNADNMFLAPELKGWFDDIRGLDCSKIKKVGYALYIPNQIHHRQSSQKLIKLVFAGTFYDDIRNPEPFVRIMPEIICLLPTAEFHFYLTTSNCTTGISRLMDVYPSNVFIHKPVSSDMLEHIYSDADILLNFSNDAAQFAPSKCFEYIASGKPILDVRYANRECSPVLKRHPMCLSIDNHTKADEFVHVVSSFVKEYAGKYLNAADIRRLYSEYMPDSAAKHFFKFICNG